MLCKINSVWTKEYKESALYADLLKIYKSENKALQKYLVIYTDAFKQFYGQSTEEPKVSDLSKFVISDEDLKDINSAIIEYRAGDKVFDMSMKIIENINKKYDIYQKRLQTVGKDPERRSRILGKIEEIKNQLNALEDIQNINFFIDYAYNSMVDSVDAIKKITSKSLEDPRVRFELATIGEYIKAFQIVKEIKGVEDELDLDKIDDKKLKEYNDALIKAKSELVDEDFIQWLNNNPQPLSSSKKLSYVVDKMEGLSTLYYDKALGAMSEYLYQFVDHTEQEIAKKEVAEEIDKINKTNIPQEKKEKQIEALKRKNLVISKEFIHNELKAASKDISQFSLWLDGAAMSDNIILQLVARSVKKQIYNGERRLIDFQNKLAEAYSPFIEGESQLNVAELNKEIVEIVQEPVFENGEFTTRPRLKYVTELRQEDFDVAKAKFFKSIGERPTEEKKLKEWNKKINEWFETNTEPKSKEERDAIIADKKAELTKEEFTEWEKAHIQDKGKYGIKYLGILSQPKKEKWENPKFKNMSSKAKAWHTFVTTQHAELQKLIPQQNNIGNFMASVRKTDKDKLIEEGGIAAMKEYWKDSINFQATDSGYGELTDLGEKKFKSIPVYFTNYVSPENVSLDVASSLMQFAKTAILFDEKNKIHSEVIMLTDIMEQNKPFLVNSKGEPKKNLYSKRFGIDRKINETDKASRVTAAFNDFIDNAYYGISKEQLTSEFFGKEVSLDKIGDKAMFFTSVISLAGNVLQSINNLTIGQIQNTMSAMGGRDYSKESYFKALGDAVKAESDFVKDFGKIKDKSLNTQLIELYDPIQGKFIDSYGKDVTGSIMKKMGSDALFAFQNLTEFHVQVTPLFAILRDTKISDSKGNTVSALEAYELKDGKLSIKAGYDWNSDKEFALREKLHGFNNRNQGVYNTFDRAMLQKHVAGRLAIMYRKHIKPGLNRRYGTAAFNVRTGKIEQGIYGSFYKGLLRNFQDWYYSMKEGKKSEIDFTEREKVAIKQVTTEMAFFLAAAIVFASLRGLDDEDESWVTDFTKYQARRLQADIAFFIPVLGLRDTLRVLRTPAVSLNLAERVLDTGYQLVGYDFQNMEWKVTQEYERKTGFAEKGDNKFVQKAQRLLPFVKNIENTVSPDEPLKFFN